MKESDSIGRTNTKSNSNGRTVVGDSTPTNKGNGLSKSKQSKKAKAMMGANNSSSGGSNRAKEGGSNSKTKSSGSPSKRGNKQSPELRPRRRASQTYFFKYQLARDPLKAEEEDLKLALLASLQQCGNVADSDIDILAATGKKIKHQATNGAVQKTKRPVGRPPKNSSSTTSSTASSSSTSTANEIERNDKCNTKKKEKSKSSTLNNKKGPEHKANNANLSNGNGTKRRGSIKSNSSALIGSSLIKGDSSKKTLKNINGESLLSSFQPIHNKKSRSKSKSTLSSHCNDLTSVQNKIKKAKKLLQNKETNKNKSNAIINKYSALRKFPSNSISSLTIRDHKALASSKDFSKTKNSKSKLNNYLYSQFQTANTHNSNTTSNSIFIPYFPYTQLQKKEPLDEDYLKKYKPETEDFLTFICFRRTAPNYHSNSSTDVEDTDCTSNSPTALNAATCGSGGGNCSNKVLDKDLLDDSQNLKNFTSSASPQASPHLHLSPTTHANNNNNTNIKLEHLSPNHNLYQRRPTRQSPRLASSNNRKISENNNSISNHTITTSTTAFDNFITYEEGIKRASIALEDMAQELNSSDGINNEVAQNLPDCISKSSSPFRNKHLVKGLMTREFAGGFADEDTIFESISNHKL